MSEKFICKARNQETPGGYDPPADCDWPFCGCDPKANEVIASIGESGVCLFDSRVLKETVESLKVLRQRIKDSPSSMGVDTFSLGLVESTIQRLERYERTSNPEKGPEVA